MRNDPNLLDLLLFCLDDDIQLDGQIGLPSKPAADRLAGVDQQIAPV